MLENYSDVGEEGDNDRTSDLGNYGQGRRSLSGEKVLVDGDRGMSMIVSCQ